MSEIDLVKLILAAHQKAYAHAHCTEGRNVIESEAIAIGYASVELAIALGADRQTEWDKGYKAALDNVVAGREHILKKAKDSGLL